MSDEGGPDDDRSSLSQVIITPVRSEAPTLPSVIITPPLPTLPPPTCGDGFRDQGEACDSPTDACCAPDCTLRPSGTVCRAAEGDCDRAETCNGEDPACPADQVASWEEVCRAGSGEPCDAPEHCTGETKTCPDDAPAPAGSVCGQPSLPCDAPELCDGVSRSCPMPTISVAPPGTVCRAAATPCDAVERCDGETYECPADGVAPNTTECRPVHGVCDLAEFCDGVTTVCPDDDFAYGEFVPPCRPVQEGHLCDTTEYCDGTGPDCPPDGAQTPGTLCRYAQPDTCDVSEYCTGGIDCPADDYAPDGTSCHSGQGSCSNKTCCPGTTTADQPFGLCSAKDPGKVVFVTSTDVLGSVGLDGADKLCNDVARSANLAGGFSAWISSFERRSDSNAVNRVGDGPYVLVDDTPISGSRAELVQGALTNGISKTEWGVTRSTGVWTGTTPGGLAAVNAASGAQLTCADWVSNSSGYQGQAGLSVTNKPNWTANSAPTCDTPLPVYCFPDNPPPGAVVFVTSGYAYLGETFFGVADGDAICNGAAQQAGFKARFVAWLSDANTDARTRIMDAPYFLVDGRRVAASLADLTDGSLENAIEVDEYGDIVPVSTDFPDVWTGTDAAGKATQHCNNWTPGRAIDAGQGAANRKDGGWTDLGQPIVCQGYGRLYCFQAPGAAIALPGP